MKAFILVAAVCFTAVLAQNGDYSVSSYPNPLLEFDKCGRGGIKSYICDPTNILTAHEAKQLEVLLGSVRNDTMCPCAQFYCSKTENGYKIGIALLNSIIPSISASDSKNPAEKIEQNLEESRYMSYNLLKRWQMGKCAEDVLILYSMVDNVFYTITGDTAAQKLTGTIIGDIAMNARHLFRPSSVFKALDALVSQYKLVFMDEYEGPGYQELPEPQAQAVRGGAEWLLPSTFALVSALLFTVF